MLKKIQIKISNYIKNTPEYIELKKNLDKLKIDLKKEIKELTQELDERNEKRKKIFINELVYGIVISFLLYLSFNFILIYLNSSNTNQLNIENFNFADKMYEKQDWFRLYIYNHDNEDDMRRMAGKIYKYIKKKELNPDNDEIIKKCLNLWRNERKKWDNEFENIFFPFENKSEKKEIPKKKLNFITRLKNYYFKK